MKKLKFKIAIGIIFALISGLVLKQNVLAAENTGTTALEKSLDELLTTKDDVFLFPEEKLAKEITARTNILKDALNSSLSEAANLTVKIEALPKFKETSKESDLKNKFLEELKGHETYYNEQREKLDSLTKEADANENLNEQLKNSIAELKNYREKAYNPRFQKMVDFVFLHYNADVLKMAKTRLDKISADAKKLEKYKFIKQGYLNPFLEKTAKLIGDADNLQGKASDLILYPSLPDEESGKIENLPASDANTTPQPTPRELMETSLDNIKAAYDIFLQISKDVRKILGIK